ncbi:MAG: hypothetical protein P0Y66_21930 [Candidatus Kaistia colombiensis]|nr:MAG: hypothetical protein P0Y66_21930 [Kaistia sp.]
MSIDISDITSARRDGAVTVRLGDLMAVYTSELRSQMPIDALAWEQEVYASLAGFPLRVSKDFGYARLPREKVRWPTHRLFRHFSAELDRPTINSQENF